MPSPLAEVIEYEGFFSDNVDLDVLSGTFNERVDFFGIPGLGKTTLCKLMVSYLDKHHNVFYIPEAVNYAIEVLGMDLNSVGPFVGIFNEQAEKYVMRIVQNNQKSFFIIKDPSLVQNQIYRFVQKEITRNLEFRKIITDYVQSFENSTPELAKEKLAWTVVNQKIKPYIQEVANKPPYRHIWITTGNLVEDIKLSLHRQGAPGRNPNLITSSKYLLSAYFICIKNSVEILGNSRHKIMIVDPSNSLQELRTITEKWLAIS